MQADADAHGAGCAGIAAEGVEVVVSAVDSALEIQRIGEVTPGGKQVDVHIVGDMPRPADGGIEQMIGGQAIGIGAIVGSAARRLEIGIHAGVHLPRSVDVEAGRQAHVGLRAELALRSIAHMKPVATYGELVERVAVIRIVDDGTARVAPFPRSGHGISREFKPRRNLLIYVQFNTKMQGIEPFYLIFLGSLIGTLGNAHGERLVAPRSHITRQFQAAALPFGTPSGFSHQVLFVGDVVGDAQVARRQINPCVRQS